MDLSNYPLYANTLLNCSSFILLSIQNRHDYPTKAGPGVLNSIYSNDNTLNTKSFFHIVPYVSSGIAFSEPVASIARPWKSWLLENQHGIKMTV